MHHACVAIAWTSYVFYILAYTCFTYSFSHRTRRAACVYESRPPVHVLPSARLPAKIEKYIPLIARSLPLCCTNYTNHIVIQNIFKTVDRARERSYYNSCCVLCAFFLHFVTSRETIDSIIILLFCSSLLSFV